MDRINEFQPNEFRSVVDRWGSLMVVGRAHGSVAVPESLRRSAAGTPGVTGGVRWDSGVVLGKFLEHSVDSGMLSRALLLHLRPRDSLNSRLVLTGEENKMNEGDNNNQISPPTALLIDSIHDVLFSLLGSDVVYSEGDVLDLLETLVQLSGPNTTIFLAGELRNDAILEYFLEAATDNFTIGRLDQKLWHPDNCSNRVVLYVLVKK
ncbi:hypothetical protein JHK87_025270 [Glycine soja]|nr:hypothetical protein JHK87_025270 [Glycine soja]